MVGIRFDLCGTKFLRLFYFVLAAFKIIKGLLPPKAVQIMKFLNTKTIQEFVDADNCLKAWGGNDDYTFKFVPEERKVADSLENNNSSNLNNNYVNMQDNSQSESNATNNGDGINTSHAKKVRSLG